MMLPAPVLAATLSGAAPVVVAHAGASAYLPPHTLAGYELAIAMGADYIEPDLQITKDGVLVAMHDATLDRTTDVEAVLGPRNGGYLVSDYTLEEIRQLTVTPVGTGATSYPGFTPSVQNAFGVPTLEEVLDFLTASNAAGGKTVGVYPESKEPYRPELNAELLRVLQAKGYDGAGDRVIVQSFARQTILDLSSDLAAAGIGASLAILGVPIELPAIYGGGYAIGMSDYGFMTLEEAASHADILALNWQAIPGLDVWTDVTADYVAAAHALGLEVHLWTYSFAWDDLAGAEAALRPYLDAGIDGIFTDNPDLGRAVVDGVPAPVPLPAALPLLAGALVLLARPRRRRS